MEKVTGKCWIDSSLPYYCSLSYGSILTIIPEVGVCWRYSRMRKIAEIFTYCSYSFQHSPKAFLLSTLSSPFYPRDFSSSGLFPWNICQWFNISTSSISHFMTPMISKHLLFFSPHWPSQLLKNYVLEHNSNHHPT